MKFNNLVLYIIYNFLDIMNYENVLEIVKEHRHFFKGNFSINVNMIFFFLDIELYFFVLP